MEKAVFVEVVVLVGVVTIGVFVVVAGVVKVAGIGFLVEVTIVVGVVVEGVIAVAGGVVRVAGFVRIAGLGLLALDLALFVVFLYNIFRDDVTIVDNDADGRKT